MKKGSQTPGSGRLRAVTGGHRRRRTSRHDATKDRWGYDDSKFSTRSNPRGMYRPTTPSSRVAASSTRVAPAGFPAHVGGLGRLGMNVQGRTYNKASARDGKSVPRDGAKSSARGARRRGRRPEFYSSSDAPRNPSAPQPAAPATLPSVVAPGTGGSLRSSSGGGGGGGSTTSLLQVQPMDDEGVIFAVSQKHPGIPFAYRSQASRMMSPERLNLDRRELSVCPILEGEEQLRLLNFENNKIQKISNLRNLPNLIFLDLYNNQIKDISGLESLATLRVLMLGKNYIRRIENLDNLVKLDVLDLHSNRISRIDNLSHLRELRVLNLAGNQIEVMENLEGLPSLTELNLRQNRIHAVYGLEQSLSLQRVFLSNNQIKSLDRLEAIFRLKSLSELTLDGNDVVGTRYYRECVLDRIKTLKLLDMRRVTDEERRMSSIVVRNDDKLERQRREHLLAERNHTIAFIEKSWHEKYKRSSKASKASARPTSTGKGYYEVSKDKATLTLYGAALEGMSIDRSFPDREKIEAVHVLYYEVSRFAEYMGRLRRFPNVTKFLFRFNDMQTFSQLNVLANTGVTHLHIADNKAASIPLFRLYAVVKIPSLLVLNRKPVSNAERKLARKKFLCIADTKSPHAGAPVKDSARIRKVARHYTDKVVSEVLQVSDRVDELNRVWPDVLRRIVRASLGELMDLPPEQLRREGQTGDSKGGGGS